MEDFFKMDVFFVVATAATVVVALLVAVALAYAIRFLRVANRIGDAVEEETGEIREDIKDLRTNVRSFRLRHLFTLFGKAAKRRASRKKH